MLDIQISTPEPLPKKRPLRAWLVGTIAVVAAGFFGAFIQNRSTPMLAAIGGPDAKQVEAPLALDESSERVRRLRTKQAVLSRREEMLRYELRQLEAGILRNSTKNPALAEELRRSRNTLVLLLKDQQDTNHSLVEFLRQVWEADGKAYVSTLGMETADRIVMSWPVEPVQGISADFEDPFYSEKFGLEHEAIDIPVLQGTEIQAAANGTVSIVANNGLGYNYIIIRHSGFATLYGHVSEFFVEPGQVVEEGDIIALSGGTPGTPGAGALTTGAHLHFELISTGRKIDPMPYLPYSSKVKVVRKWHTEEES